MTLIETRGEGGYAVVPPTFGYAFLQGALTDLPTLTAEERALLFSLGRSFQAVADDGAPVGGSWRSERPGTRSYGPATITTGEHPYARWRRCWPAMAGRSQGGART